MNPRGGLYWAYQIISPGFNQTRTYDYGGVNRLKQAAEGAAWSRSFGYDDFGNRWLNGAAFPLPSQASHFDPSNRVAGSITHGAENKMIAYDDGVARPAACRPSADTRGFRARGIDKNLDNRRDKN